MTSEVTQAALEAFAQDIFKHGHLDGWTGNQTRRNVQHVDADKGWSLYVSNGALAKTLEGHRLTAYDDMQAEILRLREDVARLEMERTLSGEGRSGAGEDWTSHDGGDCPVDPAATVEIKLRDGSVTTMAAKAVNWRYGTYIFEAHRTMPAFCEVVAYRLRAGGA